MQKILIPTVLISLLILTACQSQSSLQNSADQEKEEKAISNSLVSIRVADSLNSEGQPDSVTSRIGLMISEEGFSPLSLTLKKGSELIIVNTLDKQVDLYTTTDGTKECPLLGSTIEIPGQQEQAFLLDKPMTCTVINQQNTDQKANLVIE